MNIDHLISSFDFDKFKDYSDTLERLLKSGTCFPAGCANCEGMKKCLDCINQDILSAAFIKLQNHLSDKA